MATHFMSLPPELHLCVAETLTVHDLSSLHRTSKYFNGLLERVISTKGLLLSHHAPTLAEHTARASRFLLRGARPTATDEIITGNWPYISRGGRNALHHAVSSRNVDVARLLLQHPRGPGVNTASSSRLRETPLGIAVREACVKMVKVLLEEFGADAEQESHWYTEKYAHTPLKHAVSNSHDYDSITEIVKLLLKHGADIGRYNNRCTFQRQVAVDDYALTVTIRVDIPPLFWCKTAKVARFLITHGGADVEQTDGNGISALYWFVVINPQNEISKCLMNEFLAPWKPGTIGWNEEELNRRALLPVKYRTLIARRMIPMCLAGETQLVEGSRIITEILLPSPCTGKEHAQELHAMFLDGIEWAPSGN